MNAKDNSKVTDYVADVAVVTSAAASITHDINLSDDRRLTIVESDDRVFVSLISDNDAGDQIAAELTEYPVPSSSSSSSA
jgi:hypothetical protein